MNSKRAVELEKRFQKELLDPAWLVRVGKSNQNFLRVNGYPLVGEWTLQWCSNGQLVNPLEPFRFKNLDEVEEYLDKQKEDADFIDIYL